MRQYGRRGKKQMPKRKRYGRVSKRSGIKIKQPVQYFTRTKYTPSQFAIATGVTGASGLNFKLSDLPNYTEFTALYDQYQIRAIKIQLIPRFTESAAATSTQAIGNMWSVIDYDDSGAPGALNDLLQYQNVKRTRTNQMHSRYFKPKVADEVFGSGVATAYSAAKNVWLDCNNPVVEHYGIKFWFDATTAGVTYDMMVKMYLAFKNVR